MTSYSTIRTSPGLGDVRRFMPEERMSVQTHESIAVGFGADTWAFG